MGRYDDYLKESAAKSLVDRKLKIKKNIKVIKELNNTENK